MYTRIHGIMTLRNFIATNTLDLTYAPRVIHYPINLPYYHLTCQSLSLLTLTPVRCEMIFVRFCTGERNSITPQHGLHSTTRTIHDDQSRLVCPFIWDDFKHTASPRPTTIRSYDQNFRKKLSIQNLISNYISTFRWRISVLMKTCPLVGFCAA